MRRVTQDAAFTTLAPSRNLMPMPVPLVRLATALLVGAICLVALPPTRAQGGLPARGTPADANPVWRDVEATVGLANRLELKANAAVLTEGQALTLTVELPRDGWLNIVSIDAGGKATVLFPNQFQADNRVSAGPFHLPTAQMNFSFKAQQPFGRSLLAAFLSTEPLNLYTGGDVHRDVNGRLLEQFAQLSRAGTQALGQLGTKSFMVADNQSAPLMAGMVVAEVCPTSQPCSGRPAVSSGTADEIEQLPEAYVPGILLESEEYFDGSKAAFLQPISAQGIKLTKVSEGFRSRLYNDAAGYCTIAYGHLVKKDRCAGTESPEFLAGVSEARGTELLGMDMGRAQRAVTALVKVPLTPGQYAALCDFTFNVGGGNLKASELLKAVNAGEHHRVPAQLRRWVKAGGQVLPGLQRRREGEIALYFDGQPVPKVAPLGEDTTPLDIRTGQ